MLLPAAPASSQLKAKAKGKPQLSLVVPQLLAEGGSRAWLTDEQLSALREAARSTPSIPPASTGAEQPPVRVFDLIAEGGEVEEDEEGEEEDETALPFRRAPPKNLVGLSQRDLEKLAA